MTRKLIRGAFQLAIIGFMATMVLEGVIAASLAYPSASPLPASFLSYLYLGFDANIIQFTRKCAVYDPELTYVLRPGNCRFANREYENVYRINSLGLRDTEDALRRPEIILAGDSVTMGLGVEQDEAFPQVLAHATGRRTLNAGVSSYGTARELLLLQRLDRANLRHLVIQYWENDYRENPEFASTGALHVLTEDQYEATVSEHESSRPYWPGKYAYHTVRSARWYVAWKLSGRANVTEPDATLQAEAFVGALEKAPIDLTGVRVLVIAANADFLAAVRRRALLSQVAWVTEIDTLDITSSFSFDGARFVIDDHPTRLGHADIARQLAAAIGDANQHALTPGSDEAH
jgi:hypothetical protein